MTTSLETIARETNPEETLDYLSRISGNNTQKIKGLFNKFQINTGFNAHQNLINEILGICNQHYNKRIFSSLNIYQSLLQDFMAYADSDLSPVAPQGKWNNPVGRVSKRPIAALILMDKSSKNTELDPVYVLIQIITLAIYSDTEKSPKHLKHIANAANQVRSLVESDQSKNILARFHEHVIEINYVNELIELIKHDKDIRSNPKAISIFSAITKILPLIPIKGISHCKVTRHIPLEPPIDVTNNLFNPPTIFSPEYDLINEPEECLVFVTDNTDDTHNINEEKVAPELTANLPSSDLEELTNSLLNTKLESEQYRPTSHPIAYQDNDFSQYSRNLHNPIERHWLASALRGPEKLGANNITSLCISLSICTSINYLDILDHSIGENALFTPDGYYRRQIPDIFNAIKPNENAKKLYTEHINDQPDPYVYLPLPVFIKTQINKITKKQLEKSNTIRDLFNVKKKPPSEQVTTFIQMLNKEYGQRFNTNRISCQLKQYIKAIENDPCITYALFGTAEQKAPTAFYYRSITLGRLVSIYESLSAQYFNEKQ